MQISLVTNALEKILKYLEPLLPFANAHMVDFFTNNLYEKHISSEIRSEINNIKKTSNIVEIFWNPNNECKELNSFMKCCKNHTLQEMHNVCLNLAEFEQKLINMGCDNLSGLQMKTFMSFKKSHEVEIMSKIATAVNKVKATSNIIDIGDGKGYLSSALAMHSKMKVLGIDASSVNTVGAAKRIATMERVLKRTEKKKIENEFYKRTTMYVTETTDLNAVVKESFPGNEKSMIGLVGLHTCGDLAPSSLQIYNNNENVKTICNVGCCYHLLTETDEAANFGFPMSKYLRDRNFFLGRNARMIAAQSVDRMLHEREAPSDILFYRSLLQVLLLQYIPDIKDCHVGRFKKSATFNQYVKKSFSKLNCESIPSDDVITELYESYLPRLFELQVFYMLRAHLAPVIESIILLDRLSYLIELGYVNSYLVKVFDPVVSPRCYGIISLK